MFKNFKKEIKNRLNFLDKCLILHCLIKIKGVKIVFGADTKGLFVKYCLDIACPAHLNNL